MKRGKDGTATVKKATVAPTAGDAKRFGNIKLKELRFGNSLKHHMIFTVFQTNFGDFESKKSEKPHETSGFCEDLKKLGLLGCGGFGAVEMVLCSVALDPLKGLRGLGAQVEDLKSGETYALKNLSKGYVAVTSVQPLQCVESQDFDGFGWISFHCNLQFISGCITNNSWVSIRFLYTYLYYINPEAIELSWTILNCPHLESIPWTFQIGSRSRVACKAVSLARRTYNWCATHPSLSSSMPPGCKILPESSWVKMLYCVV